MGYEKLANVINDLVVPTSKTKTRQQLREFFQDRMIVVDEAHNVRTVDDNPKNKKVALAFKTLIKYVNYMKLFYKIDIHYKDIYILDFFLNKVKMVIHLQKYLL